MIEIKATPPSGPHAYLAGLGSLPPSLQKAISPSANLPPMLRTAIQEAASGPSTGGSGSGGTDLATPPAAEPAPTNWPLILGIGAGVLLLGVLIVKS